MIVGKKITIEANKTKQRYWSDLWRFRELFIFLAWRDVLVRYKQTTVGVLWGIIRPLLTMFIFVLVFNKVAKLESSGVPYPLMVFCGLLPWQLFSTSLVAASESLIVNANLISKVYFPRMIVPFSSIIVCLIDFFVACAIFITLLVYYQYIPSFRVIYLPFFLAALLLLAAGWGLFLSALNIRYRDFRFIVPFIMQFGLYVSPIGFSSSLVPVKLQDFYYLNPLVGLFDGVKWCILSSSPPLNYLAMASSATWTAMGLILGVLYFRSTELTIVDRI